MNKKMSFQERAKLATEQLSKQKPVTIEQMREQARRVKEHSFENLAKLQTEQLSKQRTHTSEQKREQASRVQSAHLNNKEQRPEK